MKGPAANARAGVSFGTGALLGLAVPLGWSLLDAFTLIGSREPSSMLDLLPRTALLAAFFAVSGPWVLRARRSVLIVVVLALLLPSLAVVRELGVSLVHARGLRALSLCLAGIGLAAGLEARFKTGRLRAGLCVGALVGFAHYYLSLLFSHPPHGMAGLLIPISWYWRFLVACVASLALGFVDWPAGRRVSTVLALALPMHLLSARIERANMLQRPDLPPPAITAAADSPNLVMIVIDTLRADRMSIYGHDRVTSPGLDAFARDHATLYSQARATGPFTLSSHASLFTGLQPAEHGCTHSRPVERSLRPEHPTLAERLRERGYQTALLAANSGYLAVELGMDRGFERFDNRLGGRYQIQPYLALAQLTGARPDVGNLVHRNARTMTDVALDWLDARRAGPFFAVINYLDVHSPYMPIAPFDTAFSDEQPVDPLDPAPGLSSLLYDREILYTDLHVSRFLDELEARGLFEDTVVIVTSDHGEALGERGFPEHCWTLYDNVLRVPLLIKPASGRSKPVEERRTSGAEVHDIALRELDLLGEHETTSSADADMIGEWYGLGLESWTPDYAGKVDVSLHTNVIAWFDGAQKTIVHSDGSVEAYDVDRDPEERSPLSLDPAARRRALDRARRWWREHPVDPPEAAGSDTDRLRALQALGYAGDE